MSRPIVILLLLIPAGYYALSQSPEKYILDFMAEGNVPGLFVGVVKGDSVLLQKVYGFSTLEPAMPMTDETCMELGSVSKLFTAEAIIGLYNKKRFLPDDPVKKFIPQAPESWEDITINHLLTHTSGLQNYLQDKRFMAEQYFSPEIKDTAAAIFFHRVSSDSMTSLFFTLPLEFSPGENWTYSNTGYYLLGKVVESLTGENFFTYTQNNLTLRLGMNQTRACEPAVLKGCLAKGYIQTKDGLVPARTMTGNYAFSAGGWAVTGKDMLNFLKAVNMKRLPSDSAGYDWRSNIQFKEYPFIYNGGRFFSTFHGKHIACHNGGTPGFSSSWIHVEEDSISIIVLINQQDYAPIDRFAWDILSVYVPEIRYPRQALQTPESIYWGSVLLQWMRSLQLKNTMPPMCTQHLGRFLESPGGRGLWNWYFSRGFPTALYCVDIEITEEGKIFRYRYPVNERFEYRISADINEKNQLMRLQWW